MSDVLGPRCLFCSITKMKYSNCSPILSVSVGVVEDKQHDIIYNTTLASIQFSNAILSSANYKTNCCIMLTSKTLNVVQGTCKLDILSNHLLPCDSPAVDDV